MFAVLVLFRLDFGSGVYPGILRGRQRVYVEGCGGSIILPSFACSDVYGNQGGDWVDCLSGQEGTNGNFSADPFFCDPAADDFTLHGDSPCLSGNHPDGVNCGPIGALGQGCPPTALAPSSWATIKARYR